VSDELTSVEAALREGDPTRALELLDSIPESSGAIALRALAIATLGRVTEALALVRAALPRYLGDERLLDLIGALEENAIGQPAVESVRQDWDVGTTVHGRWDVFGAAEGGMGKVYFVRDREWQGMELAVKTLRLGQATPLEADRARTMFLREAKVWLDLGGHPNIVSAFYTLQLDGQLRLFMEFVPGANLARVLSDRGRLALDETLDIAIQIVVAIDHAHGRGVVHRDLKPLNCMVMSDLTLRVTDFGLGKMLGDRDRAAGASPQVNDGMSMFGIGTPHFMAPEQWRSLGEAGPPADLYAFGALLYQLLAGVLPFDITPEHRDRYRGRVSSSLAALLESQPLSEGSWRTAIRLFHDQVDPLPFSSWGTPVDPTIANLVGRCLAKRVSERPTAREALEVLLTSYERLVGAPYSRPVSMGVDVNDGSESNRAVSYAVMGDEDEAARILTARLASDPAALYPWINHVTLQANRNQVNLVEARNHFERAIRPRHTSRVSDEAIRAFDRRIGHHLLEHRGSLRQTAIDHAARLAITVGQHRNPAVIWDLHTGSRLHEIEGEAFVSAAISPDGTRAALGDWEELVLLDLEAAREIARLPIKQATRVCLVEDNWVIEDAGEQLIAVDAATGTPHARWSGQLGRWGRWITPMVWGNQVVVFREDAVEIWTPSANTVQRRIPCHRPWAAARSCDGAMLAIATGVVEVHDLSSGDAFTLRDLPETVSLAFSTNCRTLAIAALDGTARLLDLETRAMQVFGDARSGDGVSPSGLVAFLSDRVLLHVAQDYGGNGRTDVDLRDAATGALLRRMHDGYVWKVAASGDGSTVLLGDGTDVRVFDVDPILRLREPWPFLIHRMVGAGAERERDRERDRLLLALARGDVTAYDSLRALQAGEPRLARDSQLVVGLNRFGRARGLPRALRDVWREWEVPSGGGAVDITDDGTRVIAGNLLVDAESGRMLCELPIAKGPLGVAFDREGTRVAITRAGGATVFEVATRVVQLEVTTGATHGTKVAFRGDELVTLDQKGLLQRWDRSGRQQGRLDLAMNLALTLALTRDDRFALVGGMEGTARSLRIVDLERMETVGVPESPGASVATIALSPDGRWLLTAGFPDGVALWDPHSLTVSAVLPTQDLANCLAIGDDDLLVLYGAASHAALLSLRTGDQLARLEGTGTVTGAKFSSDGGAIVLAGRHGAARWKLDFDWAFVDEVVAEARAALAGQASTLWPADAPLSPFDRVIRIWKDLAHVAAANPHEGNLLSPIEAVITGVLRAAMISTPVVTDSQRGTFTDPRRRARLVDPGLPARLWSERDL
jgi:serine/threonine protein kinase